MKSKKIKYALLCPVLLGLTCLTPIALAQVNIPTGLTPAAVTRQSKPAITSSSMAGLQLPFIENAGQTDASVGFYAQTFAGTTYVTRAGELVYSLPAKDGKPGWTLVERFDQGKLKPVGKDASISQVSYIKDQNGQAVTQNAATFGKLALGEVFAGVKVELVAHGDNVEKVYTLAPGAKAEAIRMTLAGANSLSKDAEGALLAQTGNGPVRFSAPVAWQEKDSTKTPVKVSYAIDKNGYGFELGDYDHNRQVMIDPLLQATYLGGSGSESAMKIKVHPITGDIYVLGETKSPGSGFINTFPGTAGGWQAQQKSTTTPFLARLTADLKTLVQATYIESFDYAALHLALHPGTGDVYIWGKSSDFAHTIPGTSGGSYIRVNLVNNKIFISRFSSDLTQLKQSTFISPKEDFIYGDNIAIQDIAISPINGDIYLSGNNKSYDLSNDCSVFLIPPDLKSAITRKDIGSSKADYCHGIAIHPISGDVFVAGKTTFNDFPATVGSYQPNNNSFAATGMNPDGFIAQLSPDLSTLKQSTYLGGTREDWVDTIAFDHSGNNLFMSGGTCSADFPGLDGGAYSKPSNSYYSCSVYFAKMPSDLRSLTQSTMVVYGTSYVQMLVHSSSDEVYVIGSVSIDGKSGTPAALRFTSDLKKSYGAKVLIEDSLNHPGIAYALSPLTDDLYIVGNQETTAQPFPKTTGGYQGTPATTIGGNSDIYIARFTSDDITGYVPTADLALTTPIRFNQAPS